MCKHVTILPGSLSDLCLKSYYISYYNAVVIRTGIGNIKVGVLLMYIIEVD